MNEWTNDLTTYRNNRDNCGPVAAHLLWPEEDPTVVHGHVGLWLEPGGQPAARRPRRAMHKILEEEALVRLAAEGDVACEGLLDGGQALQGEALSEESGVALVQLQRRRLGGGQLLLRLTTAAAAAAGLSSARTAPSWKKGE